MIEDAKYVLFVCYGAYAILNLSNLPKVCMIVYGIMISYHILYGIILICLMLKNMITRECKLSDNRAAS